MAVIMIWESYYWKRDLLSTVSWLKRNRNKFVSAEGDTSEELLVKLEKRILIGFYSIRKLLEAKKLSEKICTYQLPVQYFKNIKNVDHFNWHKIDELFDLDSSCGEHIKLVVLVNYFIHSYIFLPSFEDELLSGMLISSDRVKNKKLYFITTEQIYSLFTLAGSDYPNEIQAWRNTEGEFDIKLKTVGTDNCDTITSEKHSNEN